MGMGVSGEKSSRIMEDKVRHSLRLHNDTLQPADGMRANIRRYTVGR